MLQTLKNWYHLLQALTACFWFGFPSARLQVIGVTGTDGKTTTVNLIYHILRQAGKKVSMVSSINAVLGNEDYDTGFHVTTPDPYFLQKYLKMAADDGAEYMIVEATSHGLDQNRLWGVKFKAAVVTNITHEHLDYHKTYQNYLKSKAKLFTNVDLSILNLDDQSYWVLAKLAAGKKITYSLKNNTADYTVDKFPFQTKLTGEYNKYNILAALACCRELGIDKQAIRDAIAGFSSLAGRMEKIDLGQDFSVVVDFAHTPNALGQALGALRSTTKGRLMAVFGCAGLRDRQKRPLMGQVAGKLADLAVITAEDPRTEDVGQIIDQIAQGMQQSGMEESMMNDKGLRMKGFYKVPDRKEAIEFAINLAQTGDTIGIFGKGHEKSMCYGTKEYSWSDQEAAYAAIRKRLS
ncbi:UDP-N-acetylmuramoyl-L-alanyl-D-glutamate--2,6-diaminopimelate ligase [Candidatus Daviesbacteria bacterium]|nr:UDP-N-acetylmuramoyl-L-alanyl-D-glutamate--2,6-diaminopimelate ligase [Candidatus Daviesbacteria bacterium]